MGYINITPKTPGLTPQIVFPTTYVKPLRGYDGIVLVPKDLTLSPIYVPDATTSPVYVATTEEPSGTTQTVETDSTRAFLLNQIVPIMPRTLGNAGVLFSREQLDVPNVSNADLQFILAFLLDTPSYMGTLQQSNILLFQKEVIDDVTRGTDPQNAVTKARGAIKANIYLYDAAGNPLYDNNGKPVPPATGTPDTAKKGASSLLLVGFGISLLTSAK